MYIIHIYKQNRFQQARINFKHFEQICVFIVQTCWTHVEFTCFLLKKTPSFLLEKPIETKHPWLFVWNPWPLQDSPPLKMICTSHPMFSPGCPQETKINNGSKQQTTPMSWSSKYFFLHTIHPKFALSFSISSNIYLWWLLWTIISKVVLEFGLPKEENLLIKTPNWALVQTSQSSLETFRSAQLGCLWLNLLLMSGLWEDLCPTKNEK